jgi:hypothetical protein
MVGTWRSLVAHLNGVQGVASSNLAVPTSFQDLSYPAPFFLPSPEILYLNIRPAGTFNLAEYP